MFPSSVRQIKSVNPYEGFESPVNFRADQLDGHKCDYSHVALLNLYARSRGLDGLEYEVVGGQSTDLTSNGSDVNTIFRERSSYYEDSLLILGVDVHDAENVIPDIKESEGWEECKDISLYLKERGMSVRPFVNTESRCSVVFVKNMNLPIFHIVGYFISRFVPWWFEAAPLTNEEKKIATTLLDKTATPFVDSVNEAAERLFDIRAGRIKALLDGYMEGAATRLLDRKKNDVERDEERIGIILEEIQVLRRHITEANAYIAGLKSINTDTRELVEFCSKAQGVDIVRLNDPKIIFSIKSELCNFDEDVVEMCLNNANSYIYERARRRDVPQEKAKKFLEKIFFSGEYVLTLYAEYEVDFFNKSIRGVRIDQNDGHEECLLNRHISRHACLGGNEALLMDFINNSDFTGTMNMLLATTGNININEAASNDVFFAELFDTSSDRKIVTVRETGEKLTAKEAIDAIEIEMEEE